MFLLCPYNHIRTQEIKNTKMMDIRAQRREAQKREEIKPGIKNKGARAQK